MGKKTKGNPVSVRFEDAMRKALEKEAESEGLELASYIRHLVVTHPKRQKKK